MNIAILTSKNQWFVPFAKQLVNQVKNATLFFEHQIIDNNFEIIFILGYHKIIGKEYLEKHRHNIVVHESDLPKGKGWAPMFWQILEGKNDIVFSMFEASNGVDDGDIYMKKTLHLDGDELNHELREKQALFTIDMCLEFINNYEIYKHPKAQKGEESFYPKRSTKDSELDIQKTINEQFNLLRIVDNEEYPAFFYKNGQKYILKIEKADNENR
ncbi:formyltransferase family protein [Sulfurimonas sp. ST-27]|uniref:formyltransferase family protein n=1 Tax=Sulfurimonas sp. ST-27 TaxID=3400152 RepID=UPI003AB8CA02